MFNKKFVVILLALFMVVSSVFACDKNYKVLHENGLYIVKINPQKAKILPYVSPGLETVDKIAQKTNASVAINTGFFDAKNKKTVSFITSDGQILLNPKDNENLTGNINLQPYLDRIYNRGELRIYDCNSNITFDVDYHFSPLNNECKLLSSTQAGPILLPDMDLEKEFFVIKKDGKVIRDGAGMTRRTDRAMVAIKDKYIYFIITDENTPLNIYEVHQKLKDMGFKKALGFDGGGSVSLFVKTKDGIFYQDREEKGASRAIKSALIVK